MNKKGVSHLEMIISFIIFSGFVLFLLIYFPITNPGGNSMALDYAEKGVLDFVNMKMIYYTIALDDSIIPNLPSEGCFNLSSELRNISVRDETDNIIDAYSDSKNNYIQISGKFYTIYSSSLFYEKNPGNLVSCTVLKEIEHYLIGTTRVYNIVSYEKISQLRNNYEHDYSSLHDRLGIPVKNDFGFILRDTEGKEIMKAVKQKPNRAEVFARDIPVQVAYNNGTFNYFILNVQAW